MSSNVYIIAHKGAFKDTPNRHRLIKVGKANDVNQRMASAKTWFPYGLKVLKTYRFTSEDVAFSREAHIHVRFRSYHVSGEWYCVPIDQYYQIDRILSGRDELTWFQRMILRFKTSKAK